MLSFTFQIDWKQRFFLSTDETEGIETLSQLLTCYPAIAQEQIPAEVDSAITELTELREPQVIDLDEWIAVPQETPAPTAPAPPPAIPQIHSPLSQMTFWDALRPAA